MVTSEEADTRVILHCAHARAAGYHRDTDVLVLHPTHSCLVKFE